MHVWQINILKFDQIYLSLLVTVLRLEYTFPAGEPKIRLHIPSLAYFIFENDPRIWTRDPAITIRVLVLFSMANLVFPFSPHIRPMHLDKLSYFKVLTNSSL